MKIKISAEELKSVLAKIKHIAKEDKNALILSFGLFETMDDEIKITVTSLVNRASVTVGAEVVRPGACLIEAAKLYSILDTMSGDVLITDKDGTIQVKQDNTVCKLDTMPVEDFPVGSIDIEKGTYFEMPAAALVEGLKKAKKFVDNTEGSILSGVNINIEKTLMTFAATDGNRLAVVVKCIGDDKIKLNFTIPKFSIDNLLPVIKPEDIISIVVNDSLCLFEYSGAEYCTRLLQGKFPKYLELIREESPVKLFVNKSELSKVLDRIKAVGGEDLYNSVCFKASGKSLKIEAKNAKSSDTLDIEHEGGAVSFVLNRIYLEILMSVITGDTVKFELTENSRAAIVFRDMEHKYLIMPISEKNGESDAKSA